MAEKKQSTTRPAVGEKRELPQPTYDYQKSQSGSFSAMKDPRKKKEDEKAPKLSAFSFSD